MAVRSAAQTTVCSQTKGEIIWCKWFHLNALNNGLIHDTTVTFPILSKLN